ncbi:MAG: DsbA family protein [Parcubacteria group bacterium]|nr:DsbA family protein [Parcubacteria group bacterium]
MFWNINEIKFKDLLIPISILLGSVFIAVSIGFSAGKLSFGGGEEKVENESATQTIKVNARKDAPTMGKGKVELFIFSDFQCPYSKKFTQETFEKIKTNYVDTDKIKIIFRHFPLPGHTNAQKSAEAGECANKQGQFWPYHDLLFKNGNGDGTGLAVSDLKKYAEELGLNMAQFNSCLDSGSTSKVVSADFKDGQNVGVNGTPVFIINGQKLVGAQSYEAFKTVIDEALKK